MMLGVAWALNEELLNRSMVGVFIEYVKIYNQLIPQKVLGHIAPIEAMKKWVKTNPELFKKCVHSLTRLGT